jgi:hypothetical protein
VRRAPVEASWAGVSLRVWQVTPSSLQRTRIYGNLHRLQAPGSAIRLGRLVRRWAGSAGTSVVTRARSPSHTSSRPLERSASSTRAPVRPRRACDLSALTDIDPTT